MKWFSLIHSVNVCIRLLGHPVLFDYKLMLPGYAMNISFAGL